MSGKDNEEMQIPSSSLYPSITIHRKNSLSSPMASEGVFNNLEVPQTRFRRISNVSDAVSRKLSTTMASWRITTQEIVFQSRSLCGQYIRTRLKRSGLLNRKLGLQRLRSMALLPGGVIVCEIFAHLQSIGLELERLHPKLYTGICRQVSVTITSEKSASFVLNSVARTLFKSELSWGKIISLYCVAGGLAADCVRQGHPEYLFGIVETMGIIIENYAANWIIQQGGWVSLTVRYQVPSLERNVLQEIALMVTILVFLVISLLFSTKAFLRLFGNINMF